MRKDVNEVADEKFVELWLSAYKRGVGLIGLVGEQNWVYVTASARASLLRRAGVKLPTMKAPTTKKSSLEVNTQALNDMIVAELGPEALSWRVR